MTLTRQDVPGVAWHLSQGPRPWPSSQLSLPPGSKRSLNCNIKYGVRECESGLASLLPREQHEECNRKFTLLRPTARKTASYR
jgi:hypothetical protein